MIESIFLDILLILIVLLMMAIGAYRGGMREAYSAAGVLLGVLLAREWAESWGGWLERNTSLTEGGARFSVSVALLVIATGAVGYGVGLAFNYHPGPGGRMFGAALGGGAALVAVSYVLSWLRVDLFDGEEPDVVRDTFFARLLDGDAGLVLLMVSGLLIISALFGFFVREREDETVGTAVSTHPRTTASVPDKLEPPAERTHPSVPVQVHPTRQWDDRAGSIPSATDRQWSNTWPSDAPGIPRDEGPSRSSQVQQARERLRSQRRTDGSGNGTSR